MGEHEDLWGAGTGGAIPGAASAVASPGHTAACCAGHPRDPHALDPQRRRQEASLIGHVGRRRAMQSGVENGYLPLRTSTSGPAYKSPEPVSQVSARIGPWAGGGKDQQRSKVGRRATLSNKLRSDNSPSRVLYSRRKSIKPGRSWRRCPASSTSGRLGPPKGDFSIQ
jgi:hypothetical protein